MIFIRVIRSRILCLFQPTYPFLCIINYTYPQQNTLVLLKCVLYIYIYMLYISYVRVYAHVLLLNGLTDIDEIFYVCLRWFENGLDSEFYPIENILYTHTNIYIGCLEKGFQEFRAWFQVPINIGPKTLRFLSGCHFIKYNHILITFDFHYI